MLARASSLGVVSAVSSLQDHVKSLASVRDFPLFEGDFFSDALPEVLHKPTERPGHGGGDAPRIGRQSSSALAKQVQPSHAHPTSLGDTWHALLTTLPLVPRGRCSRR